MFVCVGTGLVSGMPLYLLLQLVPAWLRLEGVSLTAIGFFTLVTYPYTLKFLWSPILERYSLPFLGRRRGWMLAMQICLVASIAALGLSSPGESLLELTIIALGVAMFSATQDIVLDAYRREILETDAELALGNTVHVQAYRVSGLIPGSLGLILVDLVTWQENFFIMAGFMAGAILLTLLIREAPKPSAVPTSIAEAIVTPFKEFFSRRTVGGALAVLAFILLYKLGDNMATALSTAFYIDLGFEPADIGLIAKNAALWPSIIGGILGALIILKIGINKALWAFGVVQVLTILGFVWLSESGTDRVVLAIVIGAEYLGVGLGTAASVAFIARETSRLAVATQFALFTALASLPRVLASSTSGWIVDSIGWTEFFYFSAILALPGMALLYWVAPWNADFDRG
jgi:MFS transporter, PAT family, beta-lactamase induction signal transducer AmpG